MSLSSLHVQECGWVLPCVDFVQAVTAAVPLRVKQPFHAQKAALLTIPPASSCSFNSFCFFFCQCSLSLRGADVDVPLRVEHRRVTCSQHLTSCEAPTYRGFVVCFFFFPSLSTTIIQIPLSIPCAHSGL